MELSETRPWGYFDVINIGDNYKEIGRAHV